MSVSIRLRRMGKKKQPYYRVVVTDSRSPRDGRFIETIGTYDPKKDPAEISLMEDKALHWLRNGAKPSDTVRSLMSKTGLLKRFDEEKRASQGS